MKRLIGREAEIAGLDRCMASDQSEFVIVYGRRRVGKTFLVDQYFKKTYDFSASPTFPKSRTHCR